MHTHKEEKAGQPQAGGSAGRGVSPVSRGAVTPRVVFRLSLRGERGAGVGPAWVRLWSRSVLRRPPAGGSRATLSVGSDAMAFPPTSPPRLSRRLDCGGGSGSGAPCPRRAASPSCSTQPCPLRQLSGGSARGPISRRPFPGDRENEAVSARSPASGSRAERGRQWL